MGWPPHSGAAVPSFRGLDLLDPGDGAVTGSNGQGAVDGYLLLADISGYTSFMTDTELDHSQAIIRELTKLIRGRLSPPMRFVKLEGDALLLYSDTEAFADGERFVELIESCYFDYANRLADMERATTCPCRACAAIGSLDLKFIAHFGEFLVDTDEDGREDLAGADVILAHRLLKNTIVEGGGPEAYAFFSDGCLERLPPGFNPTRHSEEYESFGETAGGVHDLAAVAKRRREARRERVGAEDADLDIGFEAHVPPSIAWQYFVDPDKRLRWQPNQTSITYSPNAEGRTGAGASSHCVHGAGGDAMREYLDWRPFEYFTCRFTPLANGPEIMPAGIETYEFTPIGQDGVSVRWRVRVDDQSEEVRRQFEQGAAKVARSTDWGEPLRRALAEDAAELGLDPDVLLERPDH
jgi:uncharacterized protein YndB with AHSA1/START domain